MPAGRAWGVAVHESFDSVVAYVVEASVQDGRPVLHRVTAGVHCNLAVNPRSVEAQVQGAAVMGLSMCLPGAAITLKDGVVEQSNFGDFTVAAHHRHAAVRGPHRAQRRAAHRHGRQTYPRLTSTSCPAPSRPPAWANPACRRWRPRSPTPSRG